MLAQTLKQKLLDIMPELLTNDERALTSRVVQREKVTLKRVSNTSKPQHQRRVNAFQGEGERRKSPIEEIEHMLIQQDKKLKDMYTCGLENYFAASSLSPNN